MRWVKIAYYGQDPCEFLAVDVNRFAYLPELPVGEETFRNPEWLNDRLLYHNRGDGVLTGENSLYGDFYGLDDLGTERKEVQDRVVFHNTGPNQAPGLIVMSISGLTGVDLDRCYEFIVVLVNANDEAQSFTSSDFVGKSLQLHPVQASSVDAIVGTSTVDSATGAFHVPGRTTAVFVMRETPDDLISRLRDDVQKLIDVETRLLELHSSESELVPVQVLSSAYAPANCEWQGPLPQRRGAKIDGSLSWPLFRRLRGGFFGVRTTAQP